MCTNLKTLPHSNPWEDEEEPDMGVITHAHVDVSNLF